MCFCATFRRVAPPSRYEAPCPVELGLSSTPKWTPRPPGLLTGAFYHLFGGYFIDIPRFSQIFRSLVGGEGVSMDVPDLGVLGESLTLPSKSVQLERCRIIRVDAVIRIFLFLVVMG